MDSPPNDDRCPICLDGYQIPCQTNCSHWFCGRCILGSWSIRTVLQPCKCPVCRCSIVLLKPTYAVTQGHEKSEISKILETIHKYNRLFGGEPSSLLQKLRDLPFLMRTLISEIMDQRRSLPLLSRIQIAFAMMWTAIYILSPVDFLPEETLGFVGLLDDLLVLVVFFLLLAFLYASTDFHHAAKILKNLIA